MTYTPIIGLEIHVELKTQYKMFCGCPAEHFRVAPNTHTCPVCLGLPGALPVPNKQAIEWTQLIGLALNCQLATLSKFDRKHYFYPDLPKGYQISQYDQPLCYQGSVKLKAKSEKYGDENSESRIQNQEEKTIRITRVHLEEDTAKNVHQHGKTLVDFNRSSVPLVEIVTEPDFRTAEDCDVFLKNLRRTLRYLGVSDCDMEKGSMRLEVNMSLAKLKAKSEKLKVEELPNYKVEVKNINSFRYVQKAIAYEIKRQAEILDRGKTPTQETRGYQEDVDRTISQRTKEEAADYRYFPDPDIPPLRFSQSYLAKLQNQLPELPEQKLIRYQQAYQLKEDTAQFLVETVELAQYFEKAIPLCSPTLSITELANLIKNKKYDWEQLSPEELVQKITASKSSVVSDEGTIATAVKKVLLANPKEGERYQQGEQQLLGFFMGQVMRELRGQGDPKTVNQELLKQLAIN